MTTDNTLTPSDKVQARRVWREMVKNYIATATALHTMATHAIRFRGAAALADLELTPELPDLVNAQNNTSPLNVLIRAAVAEGIIRANDESIREANWKER
jgi:hypothetical protein